MRVCLLTTSFPADRDDRRSPFIFELCQALTQQNVNVDVVCPRYAGSLKEERLGNLTIHRFSYFFPRRWQVLTSGGGIPSALKRSWLAKLQFPLFYLSFLCSALRHGRKADVIHAQWSFSALAGIVLKWVYGKPLVMTERGASANLATQSGIMTSVLKFLSKHSDFITANSKQQTELFRSFGISSDKVQTIYNGIDFKRFKAIPQQKARSLLKLPTNNKIVLFVGWLIERKGVDYLIRAVDILAREGRKLHCILVGEGDQEKQLKNLVKDLHLEQFVTFVGAVPPAEVPLYLNAADVFVLPSLSEGKPNVVAEAMACKIPVLATNIPGTNELLKNDVNGLMVRPKDYKALAQRLAYLFDHPRVAQRLAQRAHTDVTKGDLTWKGCADKYIAVYRRVLSYS